MRDLARDMNHDSNMRLKSSFGNQVLDERRDARIANAFVNQQALYGQSTANRAFQAYQKWVVCGVRSGQVW